ncbi:hypothetical protein GQ55_3G258100 [Panicum hallii var. hallii]|uniref:Uncharacterized protein n=1 Tax=Panicum hallii var. hallii TaxID=1504633 RepID=A0A2T7EDD1_9POAL|nr:hypothetical protein GQ55_3G258100 [Panicum hallii var. hallii]
MAIKMDKTTIIVCSVVGSLGVLSAILWFSAERTKLTPDTILEYGDDCIYPPNPALGLGVCAATFLLVAQITFSAVGGCCGCSKSRSIPSETKRIVGIVCAVFSCTCCEQDSGGDREGAAHSWSVVERQRGAGDRVVLPDCPYLKDGIFACAGVLALAATALGITSFSMLRRQPVAPAAAVVGAGAPNKPGEQSPPHAIVVMGQPLFPQASTPC